MGCSNVKMVPDQFHGTTGGRAFISTARVNVAFMFGNLLPAVPSQLGEWKNSPDMGSRFVLCHARAGFGIGP
jgi:hypothetical protein